MSFSRDFDTILSGILTDYRNQFPERDTSQGSLIYIKSACMASALWGLYKFQDWIARQVFPDTADTETLEHHAWVRGLTRKVGESDAELLARLLDIIRHPPAGGNKHDYVQWALEVSGIKSAFCYPLAQGLGTVDVVVVADESTGSEIPGADLIAQVKAHIDEVRPVTAKDVRVLPPQIVTVDVTIAAFGDSGARPKIAAEVTAYLKNLAPGQALHLSQLVWIAVQNGATDATVMSPPANVMALPQQIIRPGAVTLAGGVV